MFRSVRGGTVEVLYLLSSEVMASLAPANSSNILAYGYSREDRESSSLSYDLPATMFMTEASSDSNCLRNAFSSISSLFYASLIVDMSSLT